MEKGKQLSFVILNFKSRDLLGDCLNSIYNHANSVDFEIIIVNNDTCGLSLEGDIKIINTGENSGFGKSCNIGAKTSKGKLLCFLNSDAIILTDIKKVVDYLNNNQTVGIVGPKLMTPDDQIQEWSAGVEVNFWDLIKNNLQIKTSENVWKSEKTVEAAWVSGAALFTKKTVFEEARGFDENFFMYFEDVDLCKRIRENGYKVMYLPEAVIRHLGGKSVKNERKRKKYFYSSQDYYFEKHFSKLTSNLVKLLRRLTLTQK